MIRRGGTLRPSCAALARVASSLTARRAVTSDATPESPESARFVAPPNFRPPTRANGPMSEGDRWWPVDDRWGTSGVRRALYDPHMKSYDGMLVPELTQVPDPAQPEQISIKNETFFKDPEAMLLGATLEQERRMLPPPTFDPAIDDVEESEWADATTLKEIMSAAEKDRERLEAFGNPMLAEDQVDGLMQPHRKSQEGMQQRQEFNGFLHWGLLKAADVALDQEADTKKAHSFVNRYLRDMDLFQQWLRHPKVVAHMRAKYRMDPGEKFDKLMAIAMALYVRSKIQCMEGDLGGALKSLVAASGMLHEGGGAKLALPRYKRALGGVLMARSAVYLKLGSPARAEDDATRALTIVPKQRCASLYQIRADAREQLGKLAEAREDEEIAADIWEHAETLHPGMGGAPVKYVH
jgi:tetratricopeptide (TPR) repeat protein